MSFNGSIENNSKLKCFLNPVKNFRLYKKLVLCELVWKKLQLKK